MFGFIKRKEIEEEIKSLRQELYGFMYGKEYPNGRVSVHEVHYTLDSCNIKYKVYYILKDKKVLLCEQEESLFVKRVEIIKDRAYIVLDYLDRKTRNGHVYNHYFVVDLIKMSSVETDENFRIQY